MKYNQPFYVPIGKGKINLHTGQRGGYYLPALEPDEELVPEYVPKKPIEMRRLWDTINQLRGQVNFLQGKIHEHLDKKPKQKGQPIKAIEYE